MRDDSEKVELLLAYGAPLESRNLDNTALHMACIAGSVRSARALVGRGADVNARGMNGNPPLIMAMANLELLRLLLRAGADPAVTCAGWTALHGCSVTNAHEAVAELLAAGADPTPRTPGGTTPVSLALAGRHAETLRLLLDAGGGPLPDRDRLPVDDWRFLNESQARWRVEAEAALAAERAALAAERAAHIATQDSFRFALPHVLQAACRPTKRPRLD